jgi:hypothetical protein
VVLVEESDPGLEPLLTSPLDDAVGVVVAGDASQVDGEVGMEEVL